MKKIILFLILTISAPAAASGPVDLEVLQQAGLSPETIGRYLAQSLDGTRLAPQVEAGLLERLGRYGGDELAAAYLNLDKRTAHLPGRDFSPQVVEQLLASDIGPANLKKVLEGEAARAEAAAKNPAAPAHPPVTLAAPLKPPAPPAPAALAEPPAPSMLSSARQALSAVPALAAAPTPAPIPAALQTQAAPISLAAPAAPSPVLAATLPMAPQASPPAAPVVAAPAAPTQRFQSLKPGQPADPGSRLAPPLDTYAIKEPVPARPYMGVSEREMADGHRYEVNSLGNPIATGQQVYARPSGHKVYRYFSGNTANPTPMVDPAQESRNREDLRIIFSGK